MRPSKLVPLIESMNGDRATIVAFSSKLVEYNWLRQDELSILTNKVL